MKKLAPIAAIAILSAAYVGSYFAMLRPMPKIGSGPFPGSYARVPTYRFHNIFTRAGYAPMLWLDQTIRPEYWFVPDAPPQHPSQPGGERR